MAKKPASLSSDLLARKGAAMPTSLAPDARTTNPDSGDPIEAAKTAAADQQSSRSSSQYGDQAEGARFAGTPEPHVTYLPDPPNPTEVWTTLRLAAGVLAVIAVASGALLAISFNRDTPSIAPVASQFATPTPVASAPPGASAPGATETMAGGQLAKLTPQGTAGGGTAGVTADPMTGAPETVGAGTEAETPNEIVAVRREIFAKNALDTDAAPAPAPAGDSERIVTGSIGEIRTPPETLRGTMERPDAGAINPPAAPLQIAALPRAPEPATRIATPPKEPRLAGAGDYLVQLSSVRSENAARQEWATLQRRHGPLLDEKNLDLQRADLGDKGIYYRVRTGAFNTKAEANAFCQKLKAAGQACLVRRVPTSG